MPKKLPEKTKIEQETNKPNPPEVKPVETQVTPSETPPEQNESGTEKAEPEKSPSSEIDSRALPNIEPHIYKPEMPETNIQPLETQKGGTVEPSTHEQKPSPLEEEDITANEPLFEPEEKSKKKLYIIVAIIIIGLAAVSVWIFMNFNKNKGAAEKKPETTQSQQISAPVVTEVKEPEGTFDRSKITLEILNGSGVAGVAKKVADSLSALEYQIVKVGNAQENTQTSQIFVSADLEKFQSEFLKDLDGIVEEATISGKLEDSTASARIIIGKN